MTPNQSSAIWTFMTTAVANHVWQSTLFVIVAGLLTLVLKRNQARIRYWIWLGASAKFLVPFVLLVSFGNHLASQHSNPARNSSDFYIAMDKASQPFTLPAAPANFAAPHSVAYLSFTRQLPTILLAVWFCGFVAILFLWCLRWRRISVAIREAKPLHEGREVDALRRLERAWGIRKPIKLVLSPASLEPGIFGVRQPILLWPAKISEHLEDAQLNAILAHEIWHVRRGDNLTAMMHMAVEAIFWFHPFVWWVGAHLVEERERACDEEVLRCGCEPQAYAEGILNVCKFYTEVPLVCVSGVTGGSLKRRVIQIMTQPLANKLSITRKLLLAGIGVAVVVGPIAFGLVNIPEVSAQSPQSTKSPTPSFEVISIKPNHSGADVRRFIAHNGKFSITATTKSIIEFAYGLKGFQLSGGPDWSDSQRYDIEIKEEALPASSANGPYGGQQGPNRVAQSLLANQFKLKLNQGTKTMPTYALVVAEGGPKIHREAISTDTKHVHVNIDIQNGTLKMQGVSSTNLADVLTEQLDRIVIDKTGLKGRYDLTLQWMPGNEASLASAIQEQLGLRLEPQRSPVPVFVIEHVEKPTKN